MKTWQSTPIAVDGIEVQIRSNESGVTFGKTVEGVYASDLLLTPDEARRLARALLEGADNSEDAT